VVFFDKFFMGSLSVCVSLLTEVKQELITYPQPQKTSIPAPSEKQPIQPPRPSDREPESRKREEGQEPRLGYQKREVERYLSHSRREGLNFRRDREKEPWSGETRQDGESKSKWFVRACYQNVGSIDGSCCGS
jgi:hypothetical protein